ncbi:hypothetical protein ES708_08598 [subsurface metagenome]
MKSSDYIGIQLGFEGVDPIAIAQLQPDDLVLHPLHVQFFYCLHLLNGEGHYQDTAAPEGKVQLLLQPVKHDVAQYFQPAFQRGRWVVKAAVDNSGVRLGNTERDVPFLLQNDRVAGIGGKFAGDRCPDHPGTHDRYVVDVVFHLPELSLTRRNSHRA